MKRLPPPLRVSIPGVLLALGVVVLAISVHFELIASEQRAEAVVVQRARLLSMVLAAELEKNQRERHTDDARSTVLRASADRAVRLAILFDENGLALESAPLGIAGEPLKNTPFGEDTALLIDMRDTASVGLRVARHHDHLNTYIPVRLASESVDMAPRRSGALAMQLDLKPALSESRVFVARRAIGLALALASICALLWLFFKFSLLRRVQALIATTTRFAGGDLAARTDIRGNDELVHLAKAFDRMAEAISVNRAALVEAERHSSFLAEVSRGLANVFDTGEPLHALARVAVPLLGDICVVHVSDEPVTLVAHVDPKLDEVLPAHAAPSITGVLAKAIESGEPQQSPPGGARLLDAFGSIWPADRTAAADLGAEGSYLVVPLRARGRSIGVIAFLARERDRYDTTELRTLAGDMAQRAALHLDNTRLYRQAQKAIRMRDEFLMVASHELRTPCTSLRLAVELLHRGLAGAHTQKMLDVAERESLVLMTLINRLLDVSRITEAQVDVQLEPVDLAATVRDATTPLAENLKESGSTLLIDTDEAVVGRWDRVRVQQVVTNLVANAIKYGRGRPIHVHVEKTADTATLTVQDEGSGIAPERQASIFDRFERAASVRHYGGLGLGLYLVRRIVEALGGTIRLTSEPDLGSTFVVELPLSGPIGAT